MYNIERRLQQANAKRETLLRVDSNYGEKLSTIKSVKEQMTRDKEWDTMNRVVLKHHEKDAKMLKQDANS